MLAIMWRAGAKPRLEYLGSADPKARLRRAVWFACLFWFALPAFSQSGASYTALRRIDTITVDGKLNEASWVNAPKTSVFTFWDGSTAPVNLQTSAQLIWDDQFLYIGFSARDADVYATYVGRDVPCWNQDAFEVFVTVPGTTAYIEVDGSPTGAMWDGYFTNVLKGAGGSYNLANLQLAGNVSGTLNNSSDQDAGYTGEIRIPFSEIYHGIPAGSPTNGTPLRLNLNRVNWNTPATLGGLGAAGSDTYYAWSPVPGTGISFHRPSEFGTVIFSTNFVPPPAWVFTAHLLSDRNVVLSGTGQPGGTCCMLSSTNLELPIADWICIVTNTFDAVSGQFRFTNRLDANSLQQYFRLQSP